MSIIASTIVLPLLAFPIIRESPLCRRFQSLCDRPARIPLPLDGGPCADHLRKRPRARALDGLVPRPLTLPDWSGAPRPRGWRDWTNSIGPLHYFLPPIFAGKESAPMYKPSQSAAASVLDFSRVIIGMFHSPHISIDQQRSTGSLAKVGPIAGRSSPPGRDRSGNPAGHPPSPGIRGPSRSTTRGGSLTRGGIDRDPGWSGTPGPHRDWRHNHAVGP